MLLTVLGSNGTYPTAGQPGSGYLVTSGGDAVVLDMGPGVVGPLMETGVIPNAIVLTHGHLDHCVDALARYNYLRFDATDRWGVEVFAPAGVVDRLAAFLDAGPDHPFHEIFRSRVIAPGDEASVGSIRLAFHAVEHPVPAVGVRVAARGKTLAYTGDTGPTPSLDALAAGADLLLCEATYQGAPGPQPYPFHMHAAEAGELARRAGVHALLITHVAPRLDPDVSVAEAAAAFPGPVRHAAPGLEVGL